MLNGIDPIIIFQFAKLAPSLSEYVKKVPFIAHDQNFIDQPPIPIYLSREKTGLYIDNSDKSVDIVTDIDTLPADANEEKSIDQRPVGSSVTVNLRALRDSIGIIVFSAAIDLIFEDLNVNDYSITYINAETTIFRAKLESYNIRNVENTNLVEISFTLTRGAKQPKKEKKNVVIEKSDVSPPEIVR